MKKINLMIIFIFIVISLNGINLKQAYKIALKNSSELKKLKVKGEINNLNKTNTLMNFFPNINYSYDYSKDKIQTLEGNNLIQKAHNYSVSLSTPIFYTNKNFLLYQTYSINSEINKNNKKIIKNEIFLKTLNYYLDVLKNKEKYQFWKYEVKSSKKLLMKAKKMYRQQQIIKLDMLENKYYHSYAKFNRRKAKHEYEKSILSLQQYLDKKINKISKINIKIKSIKNYEYYYKKAVSSNPEYKNIINKYKSAKKILKYGKLDNYPDVNFFVRKEFSGNKIFDRDSENIVLGINVDFSDLFFTDSSMNYNKLGEQEEQLSFNINTFTPDNSKINYLKSKVEYYSNWEKMEKRKNTILKMVKDAYYNFIDARDKMKIKKSKKELYREKRKMRIKQYNLGMISDSKKIETVKDYANSKLEYLNARYLYIYNYFKLLTVTGKQIKINQINGM